MQSSMIEMISKKMNASNSHNITPVHFNQDLWCHKWLRESLGYHQVAFTDWQSVQTFQHSTACDGHTTTTTTTTVLQPFFRDHPGEPVPEEIFWTLWCKERQRHRSFSWAPLHPHCPPPPSPIFLHAGCPSCRPTNSVRALKAYVMDTQNCHMSNM